MIRKCYILLSVSLLLGVVVASCAKQDPLPTQGNISGKVLDADDGTPVTGVTVSLSGNSGSYTTSFDGGYAFNDIVAGSYTITGVKTGYISNSKTVTVVPEKTVNGDFTMKKDLPNSSVSEIVFNPQNITEEQSFTLTNTREGNMSFSIQASKTWIKVSPSSGSIPSQNQFVINISIDYEAIPYNTYSEFIVINAGQASLQIPVKVTYAAPQFTINIGATEGGEVDNLGGVLEQGEVVTVTASAFNGYEFFKWSNGSTANPYSFTVTQSLNLTAEFRKKSFQITTNVEGEGSIEQTLITPGTSTSYEFESTVKLEAIPSNGWEFKEWKGAYTGSNNPIEVEVDQDKEYTAVFVRKQLDLIIEIEGEGTVNQEIVTSPTKYDYQTVVKLTAIPLDGWVFTQWKGDASSNSNPVSIAMNQPKNIIAVFEQLDTDEDGVPDSIDSCPNTPSGVAIDSTGCEAEPEIVLVSSIDLTETSKEILVGEDYTIGYTVLPSNASNKNIEIEIEKPEILDFVNGSKIRGKAAGQSKVFLKALDGSNVSNFVNVSVNASTEDVESMFEHSGVASMLGTLKRCPYESTLFNFSNEEITIISFTVWVKDRPSNLFYTYEKVMEFTGDNVIPGGVLPAGENVKFNTGRTLSCPSIPYDPQYRWTFRYKNQTYTLIGQF